MKIDVYNRENKKVDEMEIPEEIFAREWNPTLVHQVLVAQEANSRKPLAHARGRGEVRGGGKKPWRQKGTGRARHGSIRSPIWKGGGVTHGPTNERNFSKKVNKKMRRAAIFSVLSKKTKENNLRVMESLEIAEAKTKLLDIMLKALTKGKRSALLIAANGDKKIYRASSNLSGVKALGPTTLNVYDLLKFKDILLDKKAVESITKHYAVK